MKIAAGLVSLLLSVTLVPVTAGAVKPMAKCDAQAAQKLVGKKKPSDAQAKKRTGSASVRQIGPGDMVTREFRQDRVTIETDPATGRVIRASCG